MEVTHKSNWEKEKKKNTDPVTVWRRSLLLWLNLTHPRRLLLNCPGACNSLWPRDCNMPGLSVPHHLPGFAHIYVYCISFSDTVFCFCPQSFPASRTFPMRHLFASDDQNTGVSASASVLIGNIHSWSPLRSTVFFFLLSKELSGVFSSTTVWRHQFFCILPSLRYGSHNRMWPLGRP